MTYSAIKKCWLYLIYYFFFDREYVVTKVLGMTLLLLLLLLLFFIDQSSKMSQYVALNEIKNISEHIHVARGKK